jgi:hypothetical protein
MCTIEEANRDLWKDNVANIDEVFLLGIIKYGVEHQEFESIMPCTFIGNIKLIAKEIWVGSRVFDDVLQPTKYNNCLAHGELLYGNART